MLLEISIKNFAIIEEISLNFEKGMTVLTGETGAGKSIIIDAMNMMLGSRATTDVIRHGAPKAEIEGLFTVESNRHLTALFEEQGLEWTDELIIRREILQNGRSVSRINGQMVNLSVLKAVGQHLVDIHGQHDQEELMRPQLHIAMLDEFGDAAFFQTKDAYRQTSKTTNACVNKWWNFSATSRKTRPVLRCWSFKLQRLRQLPWKWMRTCVWSKNANACSITR